MQSIRSKIIIWLIKNRHLFEFKLRPEVVDENFSVADFRQGVNKVTAKMKMPQDVKTENFRFNHIKAEWVIPDKASIPELAFHLLNINQDYTLGGKYE